MHYAIDHMSCHETLENPLGVMLCKDSYSKSNRWHNLAGAEFCKVSGEDVWELVMHNITVDAANDDHHVAGAGKMRFEVE